MSTNFLSNMQFELTIARLPETTFNVRSLSLPGMNSSPVLRPTPFVNTPLPGDHIEFSPFTIEFMLDENMENYIEIYLWMIALYFPDDFNQYKSLSQVKPGGFGLVSDISLSVLSSGFNKNRTIQFTDAFPTSLGEINFSSQTSDTEYTTCTAQFYFTKFEFIS